MAMIKNKLKKRFSSQGLGLSFRKSASVSNNVFL